MPFDLSGLKTNMEELVQAMQEEVAKSSGGKWKNFIKFPFEKRVKVRILSEDTNFELPIHMQWVKDEEDDTNGKYGRSLPCPISLGGSYCERCELEKQKVEGYYTKPHFAYLAYIYKSQEAEIEAGTGIIWYAQKANSPIGELVEQYLLLESLVNNDFQFLLKGTKKAPGAQRFSVNAFPKPLPFKWSLLDPELPFVRKDKDDTVIGIDPIKAQQWMVEEIIAAHGADDYVKTGRLAKSQDNKNKQQDAPKPASTNGHKPETDDVDALLDEIEVGD